MTILRIYSSVALEGSVTRDLTDRIIAGLGDSGPVATRDLARWPARMPRSRRCPRWPDLLAVGTPRATMAA